MPITQKFSILCDEVRQENNGKFLIIGMYTPDIAVAQLPHVAPTLTFMLWLESDKPGNFEFRMKLTHLESGAVLAQGMGTVVFQRAGMGISPIRFTGIPFANPGTYTFGIHFEGQEDLLTHFSVLMVRPGVPMMPGFQQPGP